MSLTPFGQRKSDEPPTDPCSSYDATGGLSITTTPATVPLDGDHLVSSDNYERSGGEVTIKSVGMYELVFALSALAGSGTRTHVQGWLERNGVEIPGTRCAIYCRTTAMGATGGGQIYLDLNVDDVIRLRAQRTAGGLVTTLANGSRLAIRKL